MFILTNFRKYIHYKKIIQTQLLDTKCKISWFQTNPDLLNPSQYVLATSLPQNLIFARSAVNAASCASPTRTSISRPKKGRIIYSPNGDGVLANPPTLLQTRVRVQGDWPVPSKPPRVMAHLAWSLFASGFVRPSSDCLGELCTPTTRASNQQRR